MAAAASRRFRLSQSNNFYREFGNFLTAAVHQTKNRRKILLVVFISDLQDVYHLISSFAWFKTYCKVFLSASPLIKNSISSRLGAFSNMLGFPDH